MEKAASPESTPANPLIDDVGGLYAQIKKNLKVSLQMERLTTVQTKTYNHQLKRRDVVAVAPDRAGKTMAFLLPFSHHRMKHAGTTESGAILTKNNHIHMILLTSAPLYANVLYQETLNVYAHMGPFLTVQRLHEEQEPGLETKRIRKKIPTILITTPGRFIFHMENSTLRRVRRRGERGRKRRKTAFRNLIGEHATTLVLDEADRYV